MLPCMREILVHYHLFKNAGSSVDGWLAQYFGPDWGKLEAATPWGRLDDQTLRAHLLARPSLRALSSHQARPPGPVDRFFRIHPVLFLRDPIDRAGSVYEFERGLPPKSSPGAAMANSRDFPTYVDWRLEEGDGGTLCNFQTLFLGWREGDSSSDQAVVRAASLLQSLPCVGVVEHFDLSIARYSRALAPFFGEMPPPGAMLNRNPERNRERQDRVEAIRQVLGSRRFERLLEGNALDIELHARATSRLHDG